MARTDMPNTSDDTIHTETINSYEFVYYNAKWQEPVITEQRIFQLMYEQKNIPHHYFAFPWATYIDNKWKKDRSLHDVLDKYTPSPDKTYATVFQHYRFREHFDILKRLRIRYLFTPHRMLGDELYEAQHGIQIIPISLYPVQRSPSESLIDICERPLLTSFIGQYNPKNYLTNVREVLFEIYSKYDDCFVQTRKEWHYQGIVYRGESTANAETEELYKTMLCKSKFALCPSGCGPNSIRIWEAMWHGAIPVILADTIVMPACPKGTTWTDYCVFWKESEIDTLYDYLKRFDTEQMKKMSAACMELYNQYFSENTLHRIVLEYSYV